MPVFSPELICKLVVGLSPDEAADLQAYSNAGGGERDLVIFLTRTNQWFARRGHQPDCVLVCDGEALPCRLYPAPGRVS